MNRFTVDRFIGTECFINKYEIEEVKDELAKHWGKMGIQFGKIFTVFTFISEKQKQLLQRWNIKFIKSLFYSKNTSLEIYN